MIGDDGRPTYKLDKTLNYTIPGDIHFPVHDETLVNRYTASGGDVLFLQGDTGDQEAFNRFPKDPEKIVTTHSMSRERDCWEKWLNIWVGIYEQIIIAPGNHEARAEKTTSTNPAFIGMGWWWPYSSIFNNNKLVILDVGYRAIIGNNIVEHGDKLAGAGLKSPSCGVAEKARDGNTYIFGHTHKASKSQFTSYNKGKKVITTAINVGTLIDTKKQNYANCPNWQPGCAFITKGKATLL